mgnify:CR=1 FL=1
MRISTKGRYALRMLLDLAVNGNEGYTALRDVAERQNISKKYLEQIRIAKDIVYSRNQNSDIKRLVKGLMIESYIEDGCQKPEDGVYGKSITDPCLGWEKTEKLILDIADKL